MAKPKPLQPSEIAARARSVTPPVEFGRGESIEARPARGKRGLGKDESSQICFRIEKDRHKKLRMHCIENDLEIGEYLDGILKEKGF